MGFIELLNHLNLIVAFPPTFTLWYFFASDLILSNIPIDWGEHVVSDISYNVYLNDPAFDVRQRHI